MWKCLNCLIRLDSKQIDPVIEGEQWFFLCPRCRFKNPLVDVGTAGGPTELIQRTS
jgi:hypothetical protein